MKSVLAIDQGTTSTRAIIFDSSGRSEHMAQKELTQIYPQPGWVEHDPEEIWSATLSVCKKVLAQQSNVIAIGITNQRETTILWDRNTGKPIHNAIVWQDRRGASLCDKLRREGHENWIQEKTGLLLDSYFSATKIAWILDHVEGARERAEKGELAFGTVDSFLLWRLTGRHATDATNASRTLLYNLSEGDWDEDLLNLFRIPENILPEILDNDAAFGETKIFGKALPITGMAGDQHAALIGQACVKPGMIKSTYGTGCFALLNIGDKPGASQHRLLATLGYRMKGKSAFALEGSIFVAGAAVQWLRDGLKIIERAEKTEELARALPSNRGVYLVPAFTGLGAPYWNPEARGAIFGLSRDTGPAELARATLESVAYQSRDLIEAMQGDSAVNLERLRVDGGMVKNEWVCQFLADILGKPVERPRVTETTAWGVACCALLGAGIFSSLSDIEMAWQGDKIFQPRMNNKDRAVLYDRWLQCVKAVQF